MASSVDYLVSWMSWPFCKVFFSGTGKQNTKNIHTKCFPKVNFTSLALETTINLQTSKLNSISLRKQNHDWTYQVTMEDDVEVFLVPKILRLHVHIYCQYETAITKFGQ